VSYHRKFILLLNVYRCPVRSGYGRCYPAKGLDLIIQEQPHYSASSDQLLELTGGLEHICDSTYKCMYVEDVVLCHYYGYTGTVNGLQNLSSSP
jgi:hypothetical protein